MILISKIFFFFMIFVSVRASAVDGLLSTGHREAMMADGGSTNLCSAGQFINNPAGLACASTDSFSESFGSTNFAMTKMSIENSQITDLQSSQIQTMPGISLFSQSFHENNWNYGIWGAISQFSAEKTLSLSQDPSQFQGSYNLHQTNSEWQLGGFAAHFSEHFSWGATVGISQKEYRSITNLKGVFTGNIYETQNADMLAVERSLETRAGVISSFGAWKSALSLRPPGFSLNSDASKEETTMTTAGTFDEKSQKGRTRTYEPWALTTAAEYDFDSFNSLGIDVKWASAGSVSYDDIQATEEKAPLASTGLYSKLQMSSKISILSGARWTQTLSETTSQSKIENFILSTGLLRIYKGVELGSGLAYSRYNSSQYNSKSQAWEKSGQIERLDFTFSSSFTY